MVLVVVLAAVLVGVLLFGGKGNAEKPDDPAVVEPDPAPTTPLTLDQTTLNLNQAETATLTVTGAEDVLWTSSDTNVATVDDTGLVTAGIPGTATITFTDDAGATATCQVTVTAAEDVRSAYAEGNIVARNTDFDLVAITDTSKTEVRFEIVSGSPATGAYTTTSYEMESQVPPTACPPTMCMSSAARCSYRRGHLHGAGLFPLLLLCQLVLGLLRVHCAGHFYQCERHHRYG